MNKYNTFSIPRFKEFANILHDRQHALAYHYSNPKEKFTLITNFLDRSKEYVERGESPFVWGGTEEQRRILEGYESFEDRLKEFDVNWESLSKSSVTDSENSETYKYLHQFQRGELSLKNIQPGNLGEYFEQGRETGIFLNDFQKNEYPILSKYFDTSVSSQDGFISLPIVAFGAISGVVHLIFSAKDRPLFVRRTVIKNLIKQFTLAYENQMLGWVMDPNDINNIATVDLRQLETQLGPQKNPFLKDLGLYKYYELSKNYHAKRIKYALEVPDELAIQHLKQAIAAILIDSFAHNISAHCLTALSFWFKERAEVAVMPNLDKFSDQGKNNPLVLHYQKFSGKGWAPLSKELAILTKFLAEKATFQNSINRRSNFSGQIMSLYDVLWIDFIGNPLYLGSIASTEKVKKLHINITFFEQEVIHSDIINSKFIKKKQVNNREVIYLNNTLATINLMDFYQADLSSKTREERLLESVFVQKGKHFELFAEELKQCKVFFPGGIVGKQAFLTILETEIRNIKHYKDDRELMDDVEKNGLILNISIHQRHVNSYIENGNDPCEIYKIGISLKLPSAVRADEVSNRLENLAKSIVSEPPHYRPRLGGTYQDKVCAAMLFNNRFDSVEKREETERHKAYYPWVKVAIQPVYIGDSPRESVKELELSWQKYRNHKNNFRGLFEEFIKAETNKENHQKNGVHYKKYIHLWSGDDVYHLPDTEQLNWENIVRFRFVVIKPDSPERYQELRDLGTMRLLQTDERIADLESAYNQWLQIWSKSEKSCVIDFEEGETSIARITYHQNQLKFENGRQIETVNDDDDLYEQYQQVYVQQHILLRVTHGGNLDQSGEVCNYRSTGVLIRQFCKTPKLESVETIASPELHELYEFLSTRIAIFDDRIAARIQENKRTYYHKALRCGFHGEKDEQWESVKQNGFEKLHFLVVHLAYIEKMKDSNGQYYSEERTFDFIKEQVLQGQSVESLQGHFMLVITTGRGRSQWWDSIKNDPQLSNIVTYRPIEAIAAAVEDALQISDDIDLKYNLVKILIGS